MRKSVPSGIKALKEDLRFRGELPPSKGELQLRKRGDLPPSPKQLLKKLAAQDESPPSIVPTKTDNPLAITRVESDVWQTAFEYLNGALFDGTLPNVSIGYSRKAHSGGHFAPDRFTYRGNGGREHELALNPDGFVGQTDEFIVSILLHEMTHLWQHAFGQKKRTKYSYHDKEWAAKMEALGLMPSNTGMVGGKRTGQQMQHYIIPEGAYQQAFTALAASGWKLNLQSTIYPGETKKPDDSKTKFTCPVCGWIVRGKPDTEVAHIPCGCKMLPERPAVQQYDQKQAAE